MFAISNSYGLIVERDIKIEEERTENRSQINFKLTNNIVVSTVESFGILSAFRYSMYIKGMIQVFYGEVKIEMRFVSIWE